MAFTGVNDLIFLEGDISNLFYGRLIKIDRLAVLQNKAAHANLLCCTDKCSLGTLNKIAKKVTVHVIKLKPVVEGIQVQIMHCWSSGNYHCLLILGICTKLFVVWVSDLPTHTTSG